MTSFSDSKGKTWHVRIDVNAARRLRDLCGLNVFDLGLFQRIEADPVLAVDAVRAVVAPEMPQEEFASRVDRDSLPALSESLLRAVVDFFPSAATRKTLTSVMDEAARTREATETAGAASPSFQGSQGSTPGG